MTVVSKRALEYRTAVQFQCAVNNVVPMEGWLAVFLELCAKKPKKDTGKEPRVIDLDNCAKVALDAMQGCVYGNDKQVRALSIKYGEPVPGGRLSVMVVKA